MNGDGARGILIGLVQKWFTNLDKVGETEKHMFNCKAALKTITETLQRNPVMLAQTDNANKGTSKDFSRWFFSQMVRILTEPRCEALHEGTLFIIEYIIKELSVKCSKALYTELLKELVRCAIQSLLLITAMDEDDGLKAKKQVSLILFSEQCLVYGGGGNSLSVQLNTPHQCFNLAKLALYILTSHTWPLASRDNTELIDACCTAVEFGDPTLKSSGLEVLARLLPHITLNPHSPQIAEIFDLAIFLLAKDSTAYGHSELAVAVTKVLTALITGTSSLLANKKEHVFLPDYMAELLEVVPAVLSPATPTVYKEWMLQFLVYAFNTWNVCNNEGWSALGDALSKSLLLTPSLETLVHSLCQQIPALGDRVVPALQSIALNQGSVPSTEDQLLRVLGSTNGAAAGAAAGGTAGGTKTANNAHLLLTTLEAAVLGNNLTATSTLWRCCVYVALTEPQLFTCVSSKTKAVVDMIQKHFTEENWEQCLTVISNTLALYHDKREQLPSTVQQLVHKVLKVELQFIKERLLECYFYCTVLNGSTASVNKFTQCLATDKGVHCVAPLVQFLPQLPVKQRIEFVKILTTTPSLAVKAAEVLDKLVLGCCGAQTVWAGGSGHPYSSFTFQHSQPPTDKKLQGRDVKFTYKGAENTVLSKALLDHVLQLYNINQPIEVLCHALEHLPTLSLHTESVLAVVVKLALHPDRKIRNKLAAQIKILGALPSPADNKHLSPVQKDVLSSLHQAYEMGDDFRRTSTLTVISLACNGQRKFMKELLCSLLDAIMGEFIELKTSVQIGLPAIAKGQGFDSLSDLFDRYHSTICSHIAERIMDEPELVETFIEDVAGSFFYDKDNLCHYFIIRQLPYLLPPVLAKGGESVESARSARAVLQVFSEALNKTVKGLIVNGFRSIFPFISRLASKQDEAIAFTEEVSGSPLAELMRTCAQPLYNELLLHISANRDSVVWGLRMLEANLTGNKAQAAEDNEAIARLFETRLLGILVSFSNLQLGRTTEESHLVLESLAEIMRVMGPHRLTIWKSKILSILRNGMCSPCSEIRSLTLLAWDTFVTMGEVACVGPIVGDIAVALISHSHQHTAQVTKTLTHLLMTRWKELASSAGDLSWLRVPDLPELLSVKQRVDSFNKPKPLTAESFKQVLQSHLHGITRESSEVRCHALRSLKDVLHSNQDIVNTIVLGSESVDKVIPALLSALLEGIKDSDPDARLLCCTCLGELGAVDEGILDTLICPQTSAQSVFIGGVEDVEFGVELLNVLTKGYRCSSDQQKEDHYAFAIQEILAAYKHTNLLSDIMERFDENVLEILKPHLNSKYMVNEYNWPDLISPVYQSNRGTNFIDWLKGWTCLLLKFMKDVELSDLAGRLIAPCGTAVNATHIETLQFLLPNLVLQLLMSNHEAGIQFILAEIMAVIFSTQAELTIFSLMDYMMLWIKKKRSSIGDEKSKTKSPASQLVKRVEMILNKIPKQQLAIAAFNCKVYTRALMHLEYNAPNAGTSKKTEFKSHDWELLQQIYVHMGEGDGVAGVTAARTTPASLREQILAEETAGNLHDTAAQYEMGMLQYPEDPFYIRGKFKRMIHVGELTWLLGYNYTLDPHLTNEFRVHAAWSLARWESLASYLSEETSSGTTTSWAVGVGKQFHSAMQGDQESFFECLNNIRKEQLTPLSAAVMEGGCYQRCYENILQLHMLRDIEQWVTQLMFEKKDCLPQLVAEFNQRLDTVQPNWRTREPMLNLHRSILMLVTGDQSQLVSSQLGDSWLTSARLARTERLLACGNTALLKALLHSPPQYEIEQAQWLWDKGKQHEAHLKLKLYLESKPSNVSKRCYGEAQLLYAQWSEKRAYYDTNYTKELFHKVIKIDNSWEEGHFHLANYYYNWGKSTSPGIYLQMVPSIIEHYGNSLKFGTSNIFQSLPRLITTWLELEGGESSTQISSSQALSKRNFVLEADDKIEKLIESLPAYQWLTALSQLLSRICHSRPKVQQLLVKLCGRVLCEFPQQALWQIYGVEKNSNQERSGRCKDIIRAASKRSSVKSHNPRMSSAQYSGWFKMFYRDFSNLCSNLLEVSKKDSGNGTLLNASRDFPKFKKLLSDPSFTQIILPIQHNTTVTLPVGPHQGSHDPFPNHLPTISGIQDKILVLSSLQKPKKITIIGSDGKQYGLLCKPKDDLRKDCRFMEFNSMVNKLLRRDPTTRRRQLAIRTYAVIPLSENNGIVEWVDNTKLLRTILKDLYSEYQLGITGPETQHIFGKLKKLKAAQSGRPTPDPTEFIKFFKEKMLPQHPPVLAEWFRRTFSDPSSWYSARQAYIKSDRHAENIMFDCSTGGIVHVDFDCLFNKGDSFDWPEMVPFRLTHNLVDVFGVTGVEGKFRLSCEAIMSVMRNERDSLMSVLKTFVHDPLVEWARQDRKRNYGQQDSKSKNDKSLLMKDRAQDILKSIEDRLNGQMSKGRLPYGTEGQVQKIIADSMSLANLSQMYIGWAPYY